MDDIFVGRLMSTDLRSVRPDTLVADAADEMLTNGVGSLVVVDAEGHLAGILTTTDFVEIVAESQPKAETTVSRYMTTDVETASVQESIADVADRMADLAVHHMPVVDEEEGVIGIVSTADISRYVSTVQEPSPSP